MEPVGLSAGFAWDACYRCIRAWSRHCYKLGSHVCNSVASFKSIFWVSLVRTSMRGAEAVLSRIILIGEPVLVKERIQKKYRVPELDSWLRKRRTRAEAKLLHRAKLAGVLCPTVFEVEDFRLTISYINGKHPEMTDSEAKEAGTMLAKLHNAGIIHGDYTPVNLLVVADSSLTKRNRQLYVIDFGLGFFSTDIEDMAVDVFTMLQALGKNEKKKKAFL